MVTPAAPGASSSVARGVSPAAAELGELIAERPGFSELLHGAVASMRTLDADDLRRTCLSIIQSSPSPRTRRGAGVAPAGEGPSLFESVAAEAAVGADGAEARRGRASRPTERVAATDPADAGGRTLGWRGDIGRGHRRGRGTSTRAEASTRAGTSTRERSAPGCSAPRWAATAAKARMATIHLPTSRPSLTTPRYGPGPVDPTGPTRTAWTTTASGELLGEERRDTRDRA